MAVSPGAQSREQRPQLLSFWASSSRKLASGCFQGDEGPVSLWPELSQQTLGSPALARRGQLGCKAPACAAPTWAAPHGPYLIGGLGA